MTNYIFDNWIVLLTALLIFLSLIYGLMSGKAKEWLKWAVAVAEKDLGAGTGQLKLRKVYDMFIQKYPVFSTIVPFPIFELWVDKALAWMNDQLNKNNKIKESILGEENE